MPQPNVHTKLIQVIEACPCTAALMMQLGISPTQHRDQTLENVCIEHGIDPHTALDVALTCQFTLPRDDRTDWSKAPLNRLADHIVATHHEYLRRQLPRVQLLIEKAIYDHGDRNPELSQLHDIFASLRPSLEQHLIKEEQVLFPVIQELAQIESHPGPYNGPVDPIVADLEHDYHETTHELEQLRELTHGFHPPADASTAYQALMEELSSLDASLQKHAYLENDILFPRALAIQKQITGGK